MHIVYLVLPNHLENSVIVGVGSCQVWAVKATMEAVEHHAEAPASIGYLVNSITPAIEEATCQPGDMLNNCIKANVALTVNHLHESPILAEAVAQGQLLIVGTHYNLDTGAVEMIES